MSSQADHIRFDMQPSQQPSVEKRVMSILYQGQLQSQLIQNRVIQRLFLEESLHFDQFLPNEESQVIYTVGKLCCFPYALAVTLRITEVFCKS